jgi:SAM-dependent methyltransferase
MASISFDRAAPTYDATRGGLERGVYLADVIVPHMRPGPVLEVGVGTGAVAIALRERGHPVVGVDLSPAMLALAQPRLGSRVAVADGHRLPVADRSAANALIVWVLQLVPDPPGLVAEAGRVVAPGGRLVVIPAGGNWEPDDIGEVIVPMSRALRPERDRPEMLVEAAPAAGLARVAHETTPPARFLGSPEEMAQTIERREWSSLWDVPDDRWAAVVEPALAALRALPEPSRRRERWKHDDVLVFAPA